MLLIWNPEILLANEVLEVGDAAFQKKYLGKMENVSKEDRKVLFVSHNLGPIRSLLTSAILIENGKKGYDSFGIFGLLTIARMGTDQFLGE